MRLVSAEGLLAVNSILYVGKHLSEMRFDPHVLPREVLEQWKLMGSEA